MAIITQEQEPLLEPQSQNPFPFWFYFTLLLSFSTILFISLSLYTPHTDPRSYFLSLPPDLRHHYSNGKTIKVQLNTNQPPIEVFVTESGSTHTENIVIIHGLGLSSYAFRKTIESLGSRGVRALGIDLPGNGFSDKSVLVSGDGGKDIGFVARVKEVYGLIQEKGVFWAFDQMVESGELPYEEIIKLQNSKRTSLEAVALGSEETGRVLGEVIGVLSLAPVHLVLHDTALGLVSSWVTENFRGVKSVTLVDTSVGPALPLWVLNVPVVREVLLGFSFGFRKFVGLSCGEEMSLEEVEGHRVLLKGRNGRDAVVGSLKKLNYSFDIAEWGNSDAVNGIPMQVIWSKEGSKEWSEEGHRVANALPKAKFVTHSGSRWPQESKSGELADYIADFVSLLPKSSRQVAEDPIPENVQKLLEEAKASGDHQHTNAGYTDAYGLGEERST